MFLDNVKNIKDEKVDLEGVKDTVKKILIGPKEGWTDYVMRQFNVSKGGNTPKHKHNWPHINYILEGKGTVLINNKENEVEKGSIAYIEAGAIHQFKADKNDNLLFLCIIPKTGK